MQNNYFNRIIEQCRLSYDASLLSELEKRFTSDNAYWWNNDTEEKVVCSFFLSILTHEDFDARLTLNPSNDTEAMLEEIVQDVIPVVMKKLAGE